MEEGEVTGIPAQHNRKPIGLKYRVWYWVEDNRGGEPIDQKLAPIKGRKNNRATAVVITGLQTAL